MEQLSCLNDILFLGENLVQGGTRLSRETTKPIAASPLCKYMVLEAISNGFIYIAAMQKKVYFDVNAPPIKTV